MKSNGGKADEWFKFEGVSKRKIDTTRRSFRSFEFRTQAERPLARLTTATRGLRGGEEEEETTKLWVENLWIRKSSPVFESSSSEDEEWIKHRQSFNVKYFCLYLFTFTNESFYSKTLVFVILIIIFTFVLLFFSSHHLLVYYHLNPLHNNMCPFKHPSFLPSSLTHSTRVFTPTTIRSESGGGGTETSCSYTFIMFYAHLDYYLSDLKCCLSLIGFDMQSPISLRFMTLSQPEDSQFKTFNLIGFVIIRQFLFDLLWVCRFSRSSSFLI